MSQDLVLELEKGAALFPEMEDGEIDLALMSLTLASITWHIEQGELS